jgi:UDP-N-acetylglucosamine diphosphorylase/glucosamine-1-phosphate N-acetyltransferase
MNSTKNILLFDDSTRENLLPLTFTRPIAELRVGITTLKDKWEYVMKCKCSYYTVDYLSKKYPARFESINVFINASVIASEDLAVAIHELNKGEALVSGDIPIAYCSDSPRNPESAGIGKEFKIITYSAGFQCIRNSWDLFVMNDRILRDDFRRLTAGRKSQVLSDTNTILGNGQLFVEEGVKCESTTINTLTGPVYIGKEVEIMEGTVVRGPLALCDHATLKMGAKIYGATTLGPHCKAGGEVHNSIFTGYSSKAHDGFLGNAVLGEWCNLGADTNNSNLKNNYARVKLWNYPQEKFIDTGLQFCGLIMGDHSKCGINTMFNTGTVVGVSANLFGAGFPRNFVPSFSWGGSGGYIVYKPDKALEAAAVAMQRRNIELSDDDKAILNQVYTLTEKFRNFQN